MLPVGQCFRPFLCIQMGHTNLSRRSYTTIIVRWYDTALQLPCAVMTRRHPSDCTSTNTGFVLVKTFGLAVQS